MGTGQPRRVQLIDLPVPGSAAAVAAREVATRYCSPGRSGGEFTACFADQAAREPASTAAAAMRSGLAERIVAKPLDAEE